MMFKVSFLKEPHSGTIAKAISHGLWINSLEITSQIQRVAAGVGHQAIPQDKQFLNGLPVIFVPFSQIEWIASAQVYDW
jgi:hypothetical protein